MIVNTGGKSPNVVQAEASVLYLTRSETKDKAKKLYDRVCNVAKGAAIMTETSLDIEFDKACSNTITSETLEKVLWQAMQTCSLPSYTKEEMEYAEAFKRTISEETLKLGIPKTVKKHRECCARYLQEPLCTWLVPYEHTEVVSMGSTDVSDVSWVVPTAQINTACYCMGTPGHSWQLTAQGLSSIAFKGMDYAAEVLKEAAIMLIRNPELIEQAKKEHSEKTAGKPYSCPIPDGINPKTDY